MNKEDRHTEVWHLSGTQLAEADGGVALAIVVMTTVCTFWVFRKPDLPVLSSGVIVRNKKHGRVEDKALRKSVLGTAVGFVHAVDVFVQILLANYEAFLVGLQG